MPDPFLSSDEYDERAHQLYNEGRYDEAIEVLKKGLSVYPDALELLVGMGYARLAREEFAWSRQSFEAALKLDPDHEDALAGLGEIRLKLGERTAGSGLFRAGAGAGLQGRSRHRAADGARAVPRRAAGAGAQVLRGGPHGPSRQRRGVRLRRLRGAPALGRDRRGALAAPRAGSRLEARRSAHLPRQPALRQGRLRARRSRSSSAPSPTTTGTSSGSGA